MSRGEERRAEERAGEERGGEKSRTEEVYLLDPVQIGRRLCDHCDVMPGIQL